MTRFHHPLILAVVLLGCLVAGSARAQSKNPTCGDCDTAHDACLATCGDFRSGAMCIADCVLAHVDCLQGCNGLCPVVQAEYDIDVPAVFVSGDFTVNGVAPFPFVSTAHIELRSETHGVVDLGPVYLGEYGRWVVPGTYDVVYVNEGSLALPENAETVLHEDMPLYSSGIHDFDIPGASVTGEVTMNGAPPPHSVYEWGSVKLRDQQTGAEFVIGDSYNAAIVAFVIPGTYDVVWSVQLGGDAVPANHDAIIMQDVAIGPGPTVLDVDVPAVEAEGTFALNGAPPPNSVYENGEVYLVDQLTGDSIELGDTRDQTWDRVLVPGTYDAAYSVLLGGDTVPANEHALVDHDLVVNGGGSVPIDIRAVALSGDFLLDGIHFPASVYNNAKIWLQGAEPGDLFELGLTYLQSYSKKVVPGYFDVIYENLLSTGVVPDNEWAAVSEDNLFIQFIGNPPLDFDVEVFSGLLGVDVKIWGEDPPASVYHNGAILAADANGDATFLGYTKDGGGSARLVAGDYEVRYSHLLGTFVPINGDAVVGEATTTGPFLLSAQINMHSGPLAGDFAWNSAPFPSALSQLGRFSLADRETGDVIELGNSANGMYDVHLLAGTYDVVYDHQAGTLIPANQEARLGCVTFSPLPPLGVGRGLLPANR
jgi:hypothetical protein